MVLAWVQFALTICGVVYGIAVIKLLVDFGNGMACLDGDEAACGIDPISISDMPRSLVAAATLITVAAVGVIVAYQHRRGRARRLTSLGVLSVSAALDCLAAIALLSV
jgi:hypothetical protein